MPEKRPVQKGFQLNYPMLWLALAVLILYFPTFNFGYTELDDSIFIRDFQEYNENISNLITSFHRGVFDPTQDTYYRPLFLDSILLNYKISGQNIMGYHIMNVLFHLIAVLLLFILFRKLGLKELHAFILSLLFAVHPALSQAVAWIPGRNDTMLAIFILAFLIFTINYSNNGKLSQLIVAFFFLLCAFFTKETAVFAAPVAFVILVFLLRKNWMEKRNLIQYALWILAFIVWYFVRSTAALKESSLAPSQVMTDFISRLPAIVQYVGKIFLPFNLSVFPMMQDTVYYYGFTAIALLALLIYFAKEKDWRVILTGLSMFFLFLLPALLVPNVLNDQVFEHRLYLPIIGILLVLSQTVLFKNKWKENQLLMGAVIVAAAFAFLNYNHQKSFKDPVVFWSQAVETSPHSAYATMMLGARLDKDKKDKTRSYELIRKAYALNPKEKYVNFYYGQMLQNEDSILPSEKYFIEEKKISDYYECDFYLARVAFERKDFTAAAKDLESYVTKDPANEQGNNNLLLLYLDTKQKEKAEQQVKHMQSVGLSVPQEIIQRLNSM